MQVEDLAQVLRLGWHFYMFSDTHAFFMEHHFAEDWPRMETKTSRYVCRGFLYKDTISGFRPMKPHTFNYAGSKTLTLDSWDSFVTEYDFHTLRICRRAISHTFRENPFINEYDKEFKIKIQ